MSPILDIFEYSLSSYVYECVSLAAMIAYAGLALWVNRPSPMRLPANIVRRAI